MGSYWWQNRWRRGFKANRPVTHAQRLPLNRPPQAEPPVAVVLLLREPREVDAVQLAKVASLVFGLEIPVRPPEDGPGVSGEMPQFLVQLPDHRLIVQSVAGIYFEDSAVAAGLADLRLRDAVAQHRAWISVDCLPGDEAARDAYTAVARLAAALIDAGCVALCVPAQQRIYICDGSVPDKLRGPNPLQALSRGGPAPVVGIAPDDPRLLAAVREARRRWPEFVTAFEQRESGQLFSVKVPVREGKRIEHMWLSVSALEHEMIYGRLDNEPLHMRRVHAGDRMRVPVHDLNDWLFTRGDTLTGGFTIDVLSNTPKRPQRP